MSEIQAPYEFERGQQTLTKQIEQVPVSENVYIVRLLQELFAEQKRTNELLNKIYMAIPE